MNSKLLQYVVTVADARSFSVAAKKLFISQPSLSQSIIGLEKELGAPLFDRSTVPLSLTMAGEEYVRAARKILHIEQEVLMQLGDMAEHRRGRLAVGIPVAFDTDFIAGAVTAFHAVCPEVRLNLVEAPGEVLQERAQAGEVDLVFCRRKIPQGFSGVHLYAEQVLLAMGRSHPAYSRHACQTVLDLHALREERFILTAASTNLRCLVDELFAQCGFSPKVAAETHSLAMAAKLAKDLPAVTFLPLPVPEPELEVFYFQQGDLSADIYLCYRKNLFLNKVASAFIRCAKQVACRGIPKLLAVGQDSDHHAQEAVSRQQKSARSG